MRVQSYTSWQPLEEVIVGRVYDPDYMDFVKDSGVRDQLKHILYESQEDLDKLVKIIEDFGAVVKRPDLPDKNQWQQQQIKSQTVPVPPLTPRDWQITLGEKLLRMFHVAELDRICDAYQAENNGAIIDVHPRFTYNPQHVMNDAVASCIVRVGQDIFFDRSQWMTEQQMYWIRDNVLDSRYRVRQAITEGHGDAVFAILKPGVIITSMYDRKINYNHDFPGWKVHRIDHTTIDAAMAIGKFRYESLDGRWYVPGESPSQNFAEFVDRYLTEWVGDAKETVFDVNCLVLDEQHVIFSGYNKGVFDFCEQHGITPIISELRHKFFWDGGISCCTQDIRRRGNLEDYFQ